MNTSAESMTETGPEAIAQLAAFGALGLGLLFCGLIGGVCIFVPLLLPSYTNTLAYEEEHPTALRVRRGLLLVCMVLWFAFWFVVFGKLGRETLNPIPLR